jgi:DNA-binding GntR family transcriptional regulator
MKLEEPTGRSGRNGGVATQRARHGLKLLIVRGELLPGEQIRQEDTAAALGVSRVVLREALHALAEQGVLEHRPHQGYFVAKRAPLELAQVLLMLSLLEPELMRTVEWPDDAVLKELEDLNGQMADLIDHWDWLPMLALNREFHFRIFGLSPYNLVLQEVERLWALADPFIAHKLSLRDGRAKTVAEHQAILDALRARDRDACVAALDTHRSSAHAGLSPALPLPQQHPKPVTTSRR